MEASCCVARKIFLSAARASSRARTLDSRPTTKGVIMNGKMTTSRMGIMGSFLDSNFSLDVVTESPWDKKPKKHHLPEFYSARLPSDTAFQAYSDLACNILHFTLHSGPRAGKVQSPITVPGIA